jgi:pSer/pThr/pTyr-binding forkhead associated (FHA) protein
MAKLIINVPGAPASEVELKPGANRIGRSLNTDCQIAHPSVSSAHCEIVDTDGAYVVKDLGSTNGTLLDGAPVQESPLQPGQTLRLGEVEIRLATGAAPAVRMRPVKPPPVSAAAAPAAPSLAPARPRPPARSFYKTIPGAFLFPFRSDGLILLASGAAFFVVLNFVSGFVMLFGLIIAIWTLGYLFAFLQSVLTTTATGEEEMPRWPDFDGWSSALEPAFQLLAILAVCLGPAILYFWLASNVREWLVVTLWIVGLGCLPMALLAVTIYDSVAALNPLLIVLSIVRVPLEYAATCLVVALLCVGLGLASHELREAAQVPVLSNIVAEFFALYTFTVVMRVAGLLYYTKRDRLGWKL